MRRPNPPETPDPAARLKLLAAIVGLVIALALLATTASDAPAAVLAIDPPADCAQRNAETVTYAVAGDPVQTVLAEIGYWCDYWGVDRRQLEFQIDDPGDPPYTFRWADGPAWAELPAAEVK